MAPLSSTSGSRDRLPWHPESSYELHLHSSHGSLPVVHVKVEEDA
ncbi:hypothetical protein Zm00014a_007498 [Zea mays]|uniref:Uncharacterized protein n=1 Tax=Zea mays TaxID=4577 RepID=A0A3L6E2C7_MAIZE|nr:hypothetical protein Zm00014a_007499 [Zea mays]PWZ15061.1 hypothetical protein Zm00014a_007498 [Zea mays]